MGKDHTLYAKMPGVVFFHKALRYIPGGTQRRRFISVVPMDKATDQAFIHQIAADQVRSFEELRDRKLMTEARRVASPLYERLPLYGPNPFGVKADWDSLDEK